MTKAVVTKVFGVLFFIALWTSTTAFAAPTRDEVLAWFEQERSAAQDPARLKGLLIRFRTIQGERPTEARVVELRQAVDGRPDHPLRKDLEILERRLKFGPDITEVAATRAGTLEWRVSESKLHEPYRYDYGADGRNGWSISEDGQLIVADKDSGDYAGKLSNFETFADGVINTLVFGRAWDRSGLPSTVEKVEIVGDTWTISLGLTNPEGVRLVREYFGTWDSSAKRGLILRQQSFMRSDGQNVLQSTTDISGWTNSPELGRPVAAKFIERAASNAIRMNVEFSSASRIDDTIFRRMVTIPAIDQADPLNPDLKIQEIADVRPTFNSVQRVLPDGTAEAVRVFDDSSARQDAALRVAGSVALGASVVVLLAIRISRRGRVA
jgi:hypothetical protein